jgi:hypothetical protein
LGTRKTSQSKKRNNCNNFEGLMSSAKNYGRIKPERDGMSCLRKRERGRERGRERERERESKNGKRKKNGDRK